MLNVVYNNKFVICFFFRSRKRRSRSRKRSSSKDRKKDKEKEKDKDKEKDKEKEKDDKTDVKTVKLDPDGKGDEEKMETKQELAVDGADKEKNGEAEGKVKVEDSEKKSIKLTRKSRDRAANLLIGPVTVDAASLVRRTARNTVGPPLGTGFVDGVLVLDPRTGGPGEVPRGLRIRIESDDRAANPGITS